MEKTGVFTNYQKFIIAVLAFLQFTIILDFMVLSPLGAILLPELGITTSQFGFVVSGYAFSAGISGILAAGFADRYDRKKLLLFFYIGFLLGTGFCAIAQNYEQLLAARIFTGVFGGVIGSISFAIITDLFALEVRGRVMGFVQIAFSASQILGLPIGLALANAYGWHSSFWMILIFGVVAGLLIFTFMKPVNDHLTSENRTINPFLHLKTTVTNPLYFSVFLCTTLLATGGFMLMPFGSAFSTGNLGISIESLPMLYGITGLFTIFFGPMLGKLSDKVGKLQVFVGGSVLAIIMVAIYTNLGVTPFWIIVVLNVIMFLGINGRMIAGSALVTAIPENKDRGAFMSVNSSVQQISGGLASALAGMIVYQNSNGYIHHYPILGFIVIGSIIASAFMMNYINKQVNKKINADNTHPNIKQVTAVPNSE